MKHLYRSASELRRCTAVTNPRWWTPGRPQWRRCRRSGGAARRAWHWHRTQHARQRGRRENDGRVLLQPQPGGRHEPPSLNITATEHAHGAEANEGRIRSDADEHTGTGGATGRWISSCREAAQMRKYMIKKTINNQIIRRRQQQSQ